jgi:hypothetical protein
MPSVLLPLHFTSSGTHARRLQATGRMNRMLYRRNAYRVFEEKSSWEGFEVLTPVVMKNSVVWDITPCRPLKVNRRYGGACQAYYSTPKMEVVCSVYF